MEPNNEFNPEAATELVTKKIVVGKVPNRYLSFSDPSLMYSMKFDTNAPEEIKKQVPGAKVKVIKMDETIYFRNDGQGHSVDTQEMNNYLTADKNIAVSKQRNDETLKSADIDFQTCLESDF